MSRLFPWLLVCPLLLPRFAPAQPDETAGARPSLAVMPLAALHGIHPDVGRLLTDTLTFEISALDSYRVISAEDIDTMLGVDKLKQVVGCEELSCAVELAGSLDAGLVVTGSVGALGGNVTVKLTLFDMQLNQARKRVRRSVPLDESLFEGAVAAAVRELFGLPEATAPRPAGAPTTAPGNEAPPVPPAPNKRELLSRLAAAKQDATRQALRERMQALRHTQAQPAGAGAADLPPPPASQSAGGSDTLSYEHTKRLPAAPARQRTLATWPEAVGHAVAWPGFLGGIGLVTVGLIKANATADRYYETGLLAEAEANQRWSSIALGSGIAGVALWAIGLIIMNLEIETDESSAALVPLPLSTGGAGLAWHGRW